MNEKMALLFRPINEGKPKYFPLPEPSGTPSSDVTALRKSSLTFLEKVSSDLRVNFYGLGLLGLFFFLMFFESTFLC